MRSHFMLRAVPPPPPRPLRLPLRTLTGAPTPPPPRPGGKGHTTAGDRDTSNDKELFGTTHAYLPVDSKFTNMDGIFVGGFRINGKKIIGPVLLTPNVVMAWRGPETSQQLQAQHLSFLAMLEPEIEMVLIGTGRSTIRNFGLEREARKFLPIDFLDSFNAGATFNILIAEDRHIAALLFPIGVK